VVPWENVDDRQLLRQLDEGVEDEVQLPASVKIQIAKMRRYPRMKRRRMSPILPAIKAKYVNLI